jgi:hypothetical protein
MSTIAERDARYRKRRKQSQFRRALSEGDSWFDYPMCPNLIDLLDVSENLAVKRLEMCGDIVSRMIGTYPDWAGLENLIEIAHEENPRIILFSGGGNDMVGTGDIEGMFAPFVEGAPIEYYLDTEQWARKITSLHDAYTVLATQLGVVAPIFAHGYDYFVPAWKAVHYDGINVRIGPWVIREMEKMQIMSAVLQRSIGRLMITRFNEMLADVAAHAPGQFVHVDLRGTLDPDNDWANEIHPTEEGFAKLAVRFSSAMGTAMPQVIAARTTLGLPLA